MAMAGKTLKSKFKDESGKRHKNLQQPVEDQSMMMEKSWVMMMHQTDKVHEE